MYSPFSIGGATGVDDPMRKQQQQPLQGSMALPQAYHSMPVASLPPAQPFQAGQAFNRPAPAPTGAMAATPDYAKMGAQLGQSLAKGMQGYNQNQQGLLADPTRQGLPGQPPMGPGMAPPPGQQGFVPDQSLDPNAVPQIKPDDWANMFGGFGGGMGGSFGGLW